MTVGDFVKVLVCDSITGQIIEDLGNKVVIIDDSSEYEYPENCLEFHKSELELV